MNRLAEIQDWPLFWQREVVATFAALARSADGITTNGSEPPSSSTAFLSTSPAIRATATPAALAAGERRGGHPVVAQHRVDAPAADQQGLEGAVGEACLVEQLLEEERGLRHVRGVLEQADVAGHQRRSGEPHGLPEREVPRHDRQHRRRSAGTGRRPRLAFTDAGVHRLVGQELGGVLGVEPAARRRTCRPRPAADFLVLPISGSSSRRSRRSARRGCPPPPRSHPARWSKVVSR